MGKFMEQQEALKALREMKRVKKEAMAKYFYDLSKLAFAAMVLDEVGNRYRIGNADGH